MTVPPRLPRATGPGAGAGYDRDPYRAAGLHVRIALVATIVVGQLWALTVILDSWYLGDDGMVWLLVGFQALSFLVALAVWLAARER